MLTIGFTGSREGMTAEQKSAVKRILQHMKPNMVRHGDCLGADEQFDAIAKELGIPRTAHPPKNPKLRAFCDAEEIMAAKDYLVRNKDIVHGSSFTLGAPKESTEPRPARGQGTWSTIRYARATDVVAIIWPDGTVE